MLLAGIYPAGKSYALSGWDHGFIENKGQILDQKYQSNPAVLYLLNTPGLNVQLRKTGFSYDVYSVEFKANSHYLISVSHDPLNHAHPSDSLIPEFRFHRIDITLEGANPACAIIPSDTLPDYFNYFTASAPPEGLKNVRQYSKITYKNIYPDIDLEFFTNKEHSYKYNFIIHPGADINDIRLRIEGPDHISLIRDTLKFGTRFGDIEELIPESYYIANNSKVDLHAGFKKITNEVYEFSVNKSIPKNSLLVIDPTAIRLWGTYYGGANEDWQGHCAADKYGNVFLAGGTLSTNNIASAGAYQGILAGNYDCFLAKFSAAGQRLWGTYIGGPGWDDLRSCVVDKSGNIYISGDTQSTSGIASPGAHQTVFGGGNDCFIEKFNQAGNRIWGTYYGGDTLDYYGVVTVDYNGNVFLTGETYSDTGIATPGSYQPNRYNTSQDAFLAKFDSNGVRQWGTYYGGESVEEGSSCTSDISGNVYFGGGTTSLTNIASPGAFQSSYGGGFEDGFLAKFTTTGQRLWATYYGGSDMEEGFGCASDSAGSIYMVGWTKSPNGIASPGCFQPVYAGGGGDAFIVKFDSLGQRIYGTYYGGPGIDYAFGCTIGWNNDLFVVGWTTSPTNISTPDSYQPNINGIGIGDGMLVKFNADGQRQWGTYYGGSEPEEINNISYVRDDTLYVAGQTYSSDKIASPNAWQPLYGGSHDDMLIKFLDCWPIDTAGPIAGPINICMPSTSVSYSIPSLSHAITYIWTVPAGASITAGSGTNGIIVDFSSSATSGYIWVKGLNKCGDSGDSAFLYITVHQPPVPVISGPDTTCAGPGKVYSTTSGETNYQWSTSSGGVITSGGTTNIATITWNTSGIQQVYVIYTDTNGCEALSPTQFNVWVNPDSLVNVSISASSNYDCFGTSVIYMATSVHGGSFPYYQWKVNGANAGSNSPVFTYTPLNNDVVNCVLTSSIPLCTTNNPATSNTITMIVNPLLPVSVNITSSANPVCAGNSVTFTATPTNEGSSPSYQWKVNSTNVGTNSLIYSYIPIIGDIITCTLTSNALCPSGNPATSNTITMTVNPNLPVNVSVSASSNPFCLGSSVTFTAIPTNGGITPQYQWKVNGGNAGTNSSTYMYNPSNGDQVTCTLTSNLPCTQNNPATSNTVTMIVNNSIPAGVSIIANHNPFCPGTTVNYTATPVNGGTAPSYQWKVNGTNQGTNSPNYSYAPQAGDSIRCIITSNLPCVTNNPASSNKIVMTTLPVPIVTFTLCFDSITTINASPFTLKGGIPLGGTYSGPGVNSGTGVFTPSVAGVGTKTITYSYTNVSLCTALMTKNIIVQAAPVFSCGNNLTDIRDNKVYPTVQIGTQCWMRKNLNYGTAIQGTSEQTDNCMNEKYCYNDDPTQCGIYGGLYQWDELMAYENTPGSQGLCPPGWHIPTQAEWMTLFNANLTQGLAGKPLQDSIINGFRAIESGFVYSNMTWKYQGFATFFWTSNSFGAIKALSHGMNIENFSVSDYYSNRSNAFAGRCLKN
jgi:uncharacterized protein (TIGR02145 family)